MHLRISWKKVEVCKRRTDFGKETMGGGYALLLAVEGTAASVQTGDTGRKASNTIEKKRSVYLCVFSQVRALDGH